MGPDPVPIDKLMPWNRCKPIQDTAAAALAGWIPVRRIRKHWPTNPSAQ